MNIDSPQEFVDWDRFVHWWHVDWLLSCQAPSCSVQPEYALFLQLNHEPFLQFKEKKNEMYFKKFSISNSIIIIHSIEIGKEKKMWIMMMEWKQKCRCHLSKQTMIIILSTVIYRRKKKEKERETERGFCDEFEQYGAY